MSAGEAQVQAIISPQAVICVSLDMLLLLLLPLLLLPSKACRGDLGHDGSAGLGRGLEPASPAVKAGPRSAPHAAHARQRARLELRVRGRRRQRRVRLALELVVERRHARHALSAEAVVAEKAPPWTVFCDLGPKMLKNRLPGGGGESPKNRSFSHRAPFGVP